MNAILALAESQPSDAAGHLIAVAVGPALVMLPLLLVLIKGVTALNRMAFTLEAVVKKLEQHDEDHKKYDERHATHDRRIDRVQTALGIEDTRQLKAIKAGP